METITLFCVNDSKEYQIKQGQPISVVAPKTVTDPLSGKEYPVLAALVDHQLRSLDFPVFYLHRVEFIGYNHPEGRRTYIRSLSFLAQRAARSLFPEKVFKINHSLPSGLYCKFRAEKIADENIKLMKEEMRRLVKEDLPFTHKTILSSEAEALFEDLPFTHKTILSSEAEALFEAQNQRLKAGLQRSLGTYFCTVYYLDGVADNFYGPLVPSTGYLKVFDLMPFHHGFCLQYPSDEDITRPIARQKQIKLMKEEMRRLVKEDLPFTHKTILSSEAEALFEGTA